MGDDERLRELHDAYVWEVNSAVGKGRIDLVWQLADEYLDQALQLMTGGEVTGCGRPQCAVCQRQGTSPARSRRRRWLRHG